MGFHRASNFIRSEERMKFFCRLHVLPPSAHTSLMKTTTIRILHCITDGDIGGAGILLTYLLSNSHHPHLQYAVALPQDSALLPRLQKDCPHVTLLPLPLSCRSAAIGDLPRFMSCIFHFRPHVLHTHGAFFARVAGLLTPPFPYVLFSKHCLFPTPLSWLQPLTSHAALATADAAKELLVKEGYPPRRILTVPNAVPPPPLLHRPCPLPEGKLLVGFCGRLAPDKNPALLLRIAGRLAHDDRFLFVYIGSGSLEPSLQLQALRLQLQRKVIFFGHTSTPALPLSGLFALINTSVLSETCSLAVGEALALGVPVLAAPIGGNGQLIRHGQNGFLYPADSACACARYLTRMADDKALYAKLRRGAAQGATLRTAAHMARDYENFYRRLCRP